MSRQGDEEHGKSRGPHQVLGGTHDRFLIDAAAHLRRSGGTTFEPGVFFHPSA
jgi:hypothetical protein